MFLLPSAGWHRGSRWRGTRGFATALAHATLAGRAVRRCGAGRSSGRCFLGGAGEGAREHERERSVADEQGRPPGSGVDRARAARAKPLLRVTQFAICVTRLGRGPRAGREARAGGPPPREGLLLVGRGGSWRDAQCGGSPARCGVNAFGRELRQMRMRGLRRLFSTAEKRGGCGRPGSPRARICTP